MLDLLKRVVSALVRAESEVVNQEHGAVASDLREALEAQEGNVLIFAFTCLSIHNERQQLRSVRRGAARPDGSERDRGLQESKTSLYHHPSGGYLPDARNCLRMPKNR
jgi:hypothetical protein